MSLNGLFPILQATVHTDGFLPHGFCYLWRKDLLWTHIVADALIGLSYVVISVALAMLVHRARKDIPFPVAFLAFGAFIITCGMTHFMEIWTLFEPAYWASGGLKMVTAVASVGTAVSMPFMIPRVHATIRDAKLAREREIAAARLAALEENNAALTAANTALQQAVAELETVLRTVPTGIAITRQRDAQDIRVNRALAQLLGMPEASNVSKSTPDAAMPYVVWRDNAEVPADQLVMQRAAREGIPVAEEYDVVRADGSSIRLMSSAVPIIAESGEIRGAVGAFVDITERARMAEAERRAREAAEAADRAKSDFLAVMSHELRTPLNAIGGYADLLDLGLQGPLTGAQRGALGRIRRAQQHLMRIIADILAFSRAATGTLQFRVESLAVGEVLAAMRELLGPGDGERVVVRAEENLRVRADHDKLAQILLNLVSNSLKFSPATTRVHVDVRRDADDVVFAVRDEGPGIPADKIELIFEPFVQLDRALNRPVPGTGLGLAISRRLAEGMSGNLKVTATSAAGSELTLRLPHVS